MRAPFRLAMGSSLCWLAVASANACSDDDGEAPTGCKPNQQCIAKGGEGPGGAPGAGQAGAGNDTGGGTGGSGARGGSGTGEGGMPVDPDGGEAGAPAGTGGSGGNSGVGGEGGSGGSCTVELLSNPGFDATPAWTESAAPSGSMLVDSASEIAIELGEAFDAQSPPNVLWLGGVENDTQLASLSVTIPAQTTEVRVTGYVIIATELESATNDDVAYVGFIDGGTTLPIVEWDALDANEQWTFFSAPFDASGLAGRTLSFGVGATTDGTENTNFFFDSLSLTVCR